MADHYDVSHLMDSVQQADAYRSLLAALFSGASLDEVAGLAAKWAMELLYADGASVTHVEGDQIQYLAAIGTLNHLKDQRVPVEGSFTGSVVLEGKTKIFAPSGRVNLTSRKASADNILTGIIAPILSDGQVFGTIGVVSCTITSFDQNELTVLQALAEYLALGWERMMAQRDFKQLIDNTPDGVAIHRGVKLIYVNQALVSFLGYSSPEELLEKGLLSLIHDEEQEKISRWLSGKEREGPSVQEARLLKKNGEVVVLELASDQEVKFEGAPASLMVARDVTERRRMELQLVQADRLATIGTLAAGVVHEINNPLAYIMSNIDMARNDVANLVKDLQGGSPFEPFSLLRLEKVLVMLQDAYEGTCRVDEITHDLKTFARTEKDNRAPVLIEQALATALNVSHGQIMYRARLVKEYSEVPPVLANEGRLSQVLLNLLINAVHAIEEGKKDENQIKIRTWEEDGMVMIEVSDTGHGIKPEHLKLIFDPFFSTKPKGAGSGIGLSISKDIIDSLGGRLEVKSEVGKGTQFLVVLPGYHEKTETPAVEAAAPAVPVVEGAAPAEPVVEAAAPVITEVSTGGRDRILVVDDEPLLRTIIEKMLEDDYEVETAESGLAAKTILELNREFNAILCDLMMPEMSGIDLHIWLKEENPSLANRMLFMTGGASSPQSQEFLSSVPNHHLDKPFRETRLMELMRKVLERPE